MHSLTIEHMSFSYPRHQPSPGASPFSLQDISFSLQRGEILSLIGPNGCGKTTLLRVISRIFLPQSGTVRLFGDDYRTLSHKIVARRIGFVPQEHAMIFPFRVVEVVAMGRSPHLRCLRFESKEDERIIRDAMRLTDIEHLADTPMTQISGGERQRVFIARAIAQEPDILLLDEPNAHLDLAHQLDILHLARTLTKERGLTVVAVFHDLNLAAMFSNYLLLLANGSIHVLGTPEVVLTQNHISTVFKTKVTVDRHPFTGSPRVTVIPSFGARAESSHHLDHTGARL